MGRHRAGSGWTCIRVGEKYVDLIFANGRWITSGEARKWPRCTRCRAPFDGSPGMCGRCATHWKVRPPDWKPEHHAVSAMQRLHDGMEHLDTVRNSTNWKRALRS